MLGEAAGGREAPDAARAPGLGLAFLALVALTSALIVLGALVRAHGAGLACPDWPLCFGEVIPQLDFRVAFEFGHRALAGSVALVYAGLAVAAWRRPALRRVRVPLLAGGVLLAVQILLGALTVWQLLAYWSVTSHLLVGNAFNACVLWIALELRGARRGASVPAPARQTLFAVAVLLGLQLALGGFVSSTYSGMACPEWPQCNGGVWFPAWRGSVGLHLLHRWNAVALLAVLALLVWSARGTRTLRGLSALLLGLTLAQLAVGVANVWTGLAVEVTAAHSALAAALVLALTATVRSVSRPADRADRIG